MSTINKIPASTLEAQANNLLQLKQLLNWDLQTIVPNNFGQARVIELKTLGYSGRQTLLYLQSADLTELIETHIRGKIDALESAGIDIEKLLDEYAKAATEMVAKHSTAIVQTQ